MATPTRREPFADSPVIGPRGLRTHQRVLDAALEAFGESGYDRTTLDRIAELAGCSRVTIYQYASGKDDLFRRLAAQAAAQMWAAFEALDDVTPDASGHASLLACISRLADIEARYEPIIRAFEAAAETDRSPGGRRGLHHPTSRRPLRGPARRDRSAAAAARPDRRAPQHRGDQRAQPHVDPARRRTRALPPRTGRRRPRRRRAPSAVRSAPRGERPRPPDGPGGTGPAPQPRGPDDLRPSPRRSRPTPPVRASGPSVPSSRWPTA